MDRVYWSCFGGPGSIPGSVFQHSWLNLLQNRPRWNLITDDFSFQHLPLLINLWFPATLSIKLHIKTRKPLVSGILILYNILETIIYLQEYILSMDTVHTRCASLPSYNFRTLQVTHVHVRLLWVIHVCECLCVSFCVCLSVCVLWCPWIYEIETK